METRGKKSLVFSVGTVTLQASVCFVTNYTGTKP